MYVCIGPDPIPNLLETACLLPLNLELLFQRQIHLTKVLSYTLCTLHAMTAALPFNKIFPDLKKMSVCIDEGEVLKISLITAKIQSFRWAFFFKILQWLKARNQWRNMWQICFICSSIEHLTMIGQGKSRTGTVHFAFLYMLCDVEGIILQFYDLCVRWKKFIIHDLQFNSHNLGQSKVVTMLALMYLFYLWLAV